MDSSGRDLGLRRLSRLTRWTVGGAVVLTGVFSAVVAQARPGRAKASTSGGTTDSATTVPSSSDGALQPPAQFPGRGGRGGQGGSGQGGAVATSGAS